MSGDINKLCTRCTRYTLGPSGTCTHCGAPADEPAKQPHHLPPRSVLGGKYLVLGVIGEGGFGITYLGWDINLELKIAIKEYYPSGFVGRDASASYDVSAYIGDSEAFFEKGRDRFVDEARNLAKFHHLPSIVTVKDFFLENGTAYIVMEYVEGITLKQLLEERGGRMPEADVLAMMRPLAQSLAQVHRAGIIHRDISPDNIMVTPEGSLKLLDFGAARSYADENKSLSVLLKPGYAPEEQYRSKGKQGPWTDVYAFSATMFRAIEGDKPPEAMERLLEDTFAGFTAPVGENTRTVLMKGLAVRQEHRWQSMDEMAAALYGAAPAEAPAATPVAAPAPAKKQAASAPAAPAAAPAPQAPKAAPAAPKPAAGGDDAKKKSRNRIIAIGAVVAVVVLAVVIALVMNPGGGTPGGTGTGFAVTAVGANGKGEYHGEMKNGLAHGNGKWTYEEFVYEGAWANGKPNGKGILHEENQLPDEPDPEKNYATQITVEASFVDGLADGDIALTWEMQNGNTLRWHFDVSQGRVGRPLKVIAENGSSDLTLRANSLFAVPPWDEEAPEVDEPQDSPAPGVGSSANANLFSGETIGVGGIFPLTGQAAYYGQCINYGVLIAVEEINAAAGVGGALLEYYGHDSASDAVVAAQACNTLSAMGVELFLGGRLSYEIAPMVDHSLTHGNLLITPMGQDLGDGTYKGLVFTAETQWAQQMQALVDYASEAGMPSILMVQENDSYYNSRAELFQAGFHPYGTADIMTGNAMSIVEEHAADYYGTLLLTPPQPTYELLAYIAGSGVTDTVLGMEDFSNMEGLETDFPALHIAYAAPYPARDATARMQQFHQDLSAKLGEEDIRTMALHYGAAGYESVYLLAEAILKAGDTSPEAVAEALRTLQWEGLAGPVRFEGGNVVVRQGAVIEPN